MPTRLRTLVPLFASILLLAACDKQGDEKQAAAQTEKKADEPATKTVEAEAPKSANVLTLGAAKLIPTDKPDEVMEIAADGTVTAAGEILVKISSDGKLSKPDGTVIGEVGADGVVMFDGKPSGITLLEDGASVTLPDGKTATLRFAADGTVTADPKPEKSDMMTSEGCSGPVAKTCALVLMMMVTQEEPAPAPAKVEAATQPAVPPG